MRTYYNEHDPGAAAWLRDLVAARLLPAGMVDERDIREVVADDVKEFQEWHFFGGIGGWPLALQLAGWPADIPVFTGSCPCQPFSSVGKRKAEADSRHLWPEFLRLISECRPSVVFGEQVASKLGREWLARVRDDLEAVGYEVGAADLPACGVGAPHIRQRLFWVGDCNHSRKETVVKISERQRAECDGGVGFWDAYDVINCRDEKLRRIEPGTFPLAHGVSDKLALQRGFGNAIVPQAAAVFVKSYLEARDATLTPRQNAK